VNKICALIFEWGGLSGTLTKVDRKCKVQRESLILEVRKGFLKRIDTPIKFANTSMPFLKIVHSKMFRLKMTSKQTYRQCDQIGLIFAQLAIVYFGQFFKLQKWVTFLCYFPPKY
jgi:hypothetical protein